MTLETPATPHNEDLDLADRQDKWRMGTWVLALLLVGAVTWILMVQSNNSKLQAASEASQKFTLAQQVAAACAIKTQADDLGGLCAKAQQLVKEGPAGSAGIQGPPGDVGAQGPLGPKGEQGVQGLQGTQGIFGQAGTTGVTGKIGEPGSKGELGAKGDVGPQGERGEQGAPGTTGVIGATGLQGIPGLTPTEMTCVSPVIPTDPWTCTVTAWK